MESACFDPFKDPLTLELSQLLDGVLSDLDTDIREWEESRQYALWYTFLNDSKDPSSHLAHSLNEHFSEQEGRDWSICTYLRRISSVIDTRRDFYLRHLPDFVDECQDSDAILHKLMRLVGDSTSRKKFFADLLVLSALAITILETEMDLDSSDEVFLM